MFLLVCGGVEGNNEAMSEKYKNRAEIGALCTSEGGIERGNYMFDGYNSLPLLIILIGATCDCFGPTKCISKLSHNPFLKKENEIKLAIYGYAKYGLMWMASI